MKKIKEVLQKEENLILFMLVISYLSLSKLFYDYLSILRRIVLVWGVILLFREVFIRRSVLKNKYTILLLLFCIANGITTLFNFPDRFLYGVVTEGYVCVFLLVFFITSMRNGESEDYGFIQKVFWIHIILSFIFAVLALVCFVFNISIAYEFGGLELYIGLRDNRLWGFYNPNTGGSICVIALVFSFILLKLAPERKKFLYANIVLQYIYLILTQSRSAWYVFVGIIVLYTLFNFLIPVLRKQMDIGRKIKQLVIRLLIVLVICISPSVVKKVVVVFPNAVVAIQNTFFEEDGKKKESVSLKRLDEEKIREQDGTNGRSELWSAGLKVFKESPVLGVGSENIIDRGEKYLSESRFENLEKGGLHNSYLMILAASGIVGFIIMFAFFLCMVVDGFKMLIIDRFSGASVLIILLFGMMANELMEARLIYNSSYLNIVFWILAGTVVGYYYRKEKKKEVKSQNGIDD